jgi:hypothetical protein
MRKLAAILLLPALLGACRHGAAPRGRGEAQVVALSVRTEPAGAKVRVNGIDRGWVTPCAVADFSLRRGTLDVELSLEGYEPVRRWVPYDGRTPAELSIKLAPSGGGALVLVNAAPGATTLLLRVAPETKEPALFVRLWSENEAALLEALSKLTDDDARRAPMRIRDLARVGSPAVQALAKAKAEKLGGVPDPRPVAQKGMADVNGVGRLVSVPPGESFHLFATRAGFPDFHRVDVRLEARQELTVDAAMTAPPRPPAEPPPAAQNAKAPGPRVKVTSPGGVVRVSVAGKPVAERPSRAGERVEFEVPPGPVHVDFLDAATGAVTHSVDLLPDGTEPRPVAEGDRVGQVQLVHPVYGVFVRLDPGLQLAPGDEIVIARDGFEVARAKVVRVAGSDATYPDGAAQVARSGGPVRKGDEVRRPGR